MTDLETEKSLAAARAVEEVVDDMMVGLGSGSTAAYAIRGIGRRVKAGLKITAVATSTATEILARSVGIELTPFEHISKLDLTIDGADEINPQLQAIKGGGGALLREKVVAAASDRVIIIVDSSKPVSQLGRFRLPVEVLPFGCAFVEHALKEFGFPVGKRLKPDGTPFLTDQGAYIFDIAFGLIADPAVLAGSLDAIPSIIEHGLFLNEIDVAIIGRGNGVEIIRKAIKEWDHVGKKY